MEKKSLTQSGINLPYLLYGLIALVMIGTSLYLTDHYYETIFPTTIGGGKSLCDISSFWNCDVATYSPVAAFAGVPIAFFGVIIGGLFLISVFMPSDRLDQTASAVSKYNLLGCLLLFTYSLVALGSLCPMCSLYYVLSAGVAVLFMSRGPNSWVPDMKVGGITLAVLLVGAIGFNRYTAGKVQTQNNIASQIITQYNALADYGDPETESPFKLHSATPKFADAPIRVSVFSDFQCPFCQKVAEQTAQLIRQYGDKINVQYLFYPLDSSCNPSMKAPVHPYACRAAMLAACDAAKFPKVHDEIFAAQEGLTLDTLKKIADDNGLGACFEAQSSKDAVLAAMNQATKYNLHSTPTIIINGRKIEGSIPNPQFQAIFDELLRKK